MTTVAVVGLGRMGSGMARALAASGHGDIDLVLHNRTPDRARELATELGARVAGTPADAAAQAEVTITMLADGGAVASVWDGENGLLDAAHTGSVLVDMSTVPPGTLPPYAERARAAGAELLDAPVSGSVALAESGSLTIMAGGNAAALERVRPVLDRLSQRIFHMGPLGSGHAMKLAVNAVIFAINNGVSEALVLAERAGIVREDAYEVLASGAAGAPFVGYKRDAFIGPDTAPVGFSLDLAGKDLDLITSFASALGVPMPLAVVSRDVISQAAGALGGERDFSAVAVHLRTLSGEGSATG